MLRDTDQHTPLHGVTFHDWELDDRQFTDQLVMLTSFTELTQQQLDTACAQLRRSRASGLVVRSLDDARTAPLRASCDRHDLALLSVHPSVGWREFDALVSRLLGEHGSGLRLGASSGDKLFALANSIAQVFHGSVAIEDHRRNILAYSALPGQAIDSFRASGILTRRTPDGPLNEIRYRQVFATDGISRFPTDNHYAPRVAIPVRAGNIPLGSIWVIDPDGEAIDSPLSPEKQEVLENAAVFAAGYLVDAWRFDHGDERSKDAAIRRLFSGTTQENDTTVLGLRPEHSYLVSAVDVASTLQGDLSEARTAVSRHLAVYFPGSICTTVEGKIIALIPSGSVSPVILSVERLLPELVRLTGSECSFGLTHPRRPSRSFVNDYERASRVAECARALGLSIATPEDVQPQLVLHECADALDSAGLTLPEMRTLLADDETETRATLLAWLEEHGNAPRVAARLNVHEQTVRYRIRQAVSRIGLDLDDPDRRLTLWLQLRLAALR